MATQWFKFEIPLNADGTRVSYSPGWHGTIPRCPKNVVVDLYNDKEGYGIAHTTDTFMPKEVMAIKAIDITTTLSAARKVQGAEFGEAIVHKWDVKPIEVAPIEKVALDG